MKKLIVLFLVISFLVMNCATYERGESINLDPSQKPGAKLIIQKADGQQVKGELIAVKQNSLLLKEHASGTDVSVDIIDVNVIKIIKKSKALLGAGIGLLVGGGLGGAIAYSSYDEGWDEATYGLVIGSAFVLLGLIGGIVLGTQAGKEKTIQIEGKSDSEIKEILEDLRKKARVPDFQWTSSRKTGPLKNIVFSGKISKRRFCR